LKATTASQLSRHDELDPLASFRPPPGAAMLALGVFIAGLAVAFLWLLGGYVVIKGRASMEPLAIPVWFWFSTFALLVSSVVLQWSYLSARAGRLVTSSNTLLLSTALGCLFLLLQTPGVLRLIETNRQVAEQHATLYLLVLVLVLLHGLHALVGLGRMIVLNNRTHRRSSNKNSAAHLKQMCLIWHFLAIVWVVMFGVILWA
jgi:cytochrome c oxidase subunit III